MKTFEIGKRYTLVDAEKSTELIILRALGLFVDTTDIVWTCSHIDGDGDGDVWSSDDGLPKNAPEQDGLFLVAPKNGLECGAYALVEEV